MINFKYTAPINKSNEMYNTEKNVRKKKKKEIQPKQKHCSCYETGLRRDDLTC